MKKFFIEMIYILNIYGLGENSKYIDKYDEGVL